MASLKHIIPIAIILSSFRLSGSTWSTSQDPSRHPQAYDLQMTCMNRLFQKDMSSYYSTPYIPALPVVWIRIQNPDHATYTCAVKLDHSDCYSCKRCHHESKHAYLVLRPEDNKWIFKCKSGTFGKGNKGAGLARLEDFEDSNNEKRFRVNRNTVNTGHFDQEIETDEAPNNSRGAQSVSSTLQKGSYSHQVMVSNEHRKTSDRFEGGISEVKHADDFLIRGLGADAVFEDYSEVLEDHLKERAELNDQNLMDGGTNSIPEEMNLRHPASSAEHQKSQDPPISLAIKADKVPSPSSNWMSSLYSLFQSDEGEENNATEKGLVTGSESGQQLELSLKGRPDDANSIMTEGIENGAPNEVPEEYDEDADLEKADRNRIVYWALLGVFLFVIICFVAVVLVLIIIKIHRRKRSSLSQQPNVEEGNNFWNTCGPEHMKTLTPKIDGKLERTNSWNGGSPHDDHLCR